MKKAIVTVGCSGSGKSTYTGDILKNNERNLVVILERDIIRRNILLSKEFDIYVENMWKYWNFKWEPEVTEIIDSIYNKNKDRENVTLVFSDTNLNIDRRNALVQKLKSDGFEVEIKVVGQELDFKELCKRDNGRLHSVGYETLWKQYETFRKEFPLYPHLLQSKLSNLNSLPKAIMVDIDGTIAHANSGRSMYEWDRVDEDDVDEIIAATVIACKNANYEVIFMSGRDSSCRTKTLNWLDKNLGFQDYLLFMREKHDMRKDSIVKLELFEQYVYGNYNVISVFDDRPQVVRLWMELGLKVINCGNLYKEF